MVVPTSLRVKERQNIRSASVLRIGTTNRYNRHNLSLDSRMRNYDERWCKIKDSRQGARQCFRVQC